MKISLIKAFNPLGILLITIASIIIIGLVILLLITYSPSHLGVLNPGFTINEIYSFERIELEGEYISFSMDKGGFLVPGYRGGLVYSMVILGEGEFKLSTPDGVIENSFSALYLPLQPKDYQYLRENLILDTTYNASVIERANKVFHENRKTFLFVEPFNQLRMFPPPSENLLGVIYSSDYGKIKYIEGKSVIFRPKEGKQVSFFNSRGTVSYPSPWIYNTMGVGIVLMTSILIISCFVITLDVHNRPEAVTSFDAGSSKSSKALTSFFLLTAFGSTMPGIVELYGVQNINHVLYPVIAFMAVFIKVRQGYPLRGMGFNLNYPLRSLLVGITLAVLGFFMGSLGLPKGFYISNPKLLVLPILISFSKEIFYRGFIQTTLEDFTGPWPAILITSMVAGLTYLIPGLFSLGLEPAVMFNSLLTIPCTAAVSGYIFMKTRSLLGTVIFAALLEILPSIAVF